MAAPALRADDVGRLPAKYDVERVLGRGGMGTVYSARHSRLGHRVAIKVLGDDLRAVPELVTRFEREAHAAGALSSPHAVRIYDIDKTDDGTPFMVMELLYGSDLARLIELDGPQPLGTAVRWILEACDAIGEAHHLGIVHRDLKPSNLFLCNDTGSVKVLDFGIAKRVAANEAALTQGVAPLGTPQYMSPEQVRCAKDVDGRTDIWSLGVTLYELVCGRPPFNHEIAQACIVAIAVDPVPDPREFRPDLPDELAAIILRALEKDARARYQSVEELVLALAPFAEAPPLADDSWRVVSTARRIVARELTTIDGESVLELRLASMKDREVQTVPPAVHRASTRRPRGKRIRSTIALGVAAVVALGAAAFAPRWMRTRVEAPSMTQVTAPPAANEPEPPAPTKAKPAEPAEKVSPAEKQARPNINPVKASPAAVPAQRPRNAVMRAPASSASARTSVPLVHGGLSSPGF